MAKENRDRMEQFASARPEQVHRLLRAAADGMGVGAVGDILSAMVEHRRSMLTDRQTSLLMYIKLIASMYTGNVLPLEAAMELDFRILPGVIARGLVRWEIDDEGSVVLALRGPDGQ